MEKWKRRAFDLVASMILGGKREMSVVPYYPQKTEVGGREDNYFKRTLPEKCGMSSKRIYNMLCELEAEPRANVHSLMVLRHGRVICECSAKGYNVAEWHISHSMAKSICGMVIGRLVSGVHWITDIIGGALFSTAIVLIYYAICNIATNNR